MARVTLSLGSNLGDKRGAIAKALSALDAGGARILTRSADYRTEPWGRLLRTGS
ncbi:2-amino-4-hydroxy-6-hydroxymethyldihydropteridine diphosphokinase [Microvirga tunisiensis]|uniref:2-amino-4-hydroxy-6- hydroxymethyldihydropteridine diphosphokinase n=1 Tax=Microvirga tunisiensis TaxID=2108360 RepID=UPI003B8459D6